jgi:phospholipase B-like protein
MTTPLRIALLLLLGTCGLAVFAGRSGAKSPAVSSAAQNPASAKAWRFEQGGWIYVHLEGSPADIGFQHGALLAPEIVDGLEAVKLNATHSTGKDWKFFREAGRQMLWPKMDREYQEELQGIVEGLKSKGVKYDLDDVVALNAMEELPDYYTPWYNARHKIPGPKIVSPGNCSAFVATGSATKDGGIVIAHNNWTGYMTGERWRIVFDLVPARGHRILMDGYPGVIASDDDFGVNDAGIMVTETTITQFEGWDPNGKPEFERARKALQYADSIDDYVRIMLDGNNGGYANDWLLGDRKTGEIAQFELGLKRHQLWRTKDGSFVGSNFALDPQVIAADTKFDPKNRSSSPNARRERWDALMKESKGKIDVASAQSFLSDHMDAFEGRVQANERALCGHTDTSPRGVKEWEWGPYYPGGAVQGKAMDSRMAESMSFAARMGHPCGEDFVAEPFLKAHPEFNWQASRLTDMKAGPWTVFRTGQRGPG